MKTKFKTLAQTTLIATLILGAVAPAHAGLFSRKKPVEQSPEQILNVMNKPESAEQAEVAENLLREMSIRLTEQMSKIEGLIKAGRSNEALRDSKELLDSVRIKTGIDPKARLRESFLVPTVFPENAKIMSDLNEQQKDDVTRAIRDYRGGSYLDVMNLSKRISLLYIKALHAEVKKSGGLTQEDRNKIIKDLAVASIIPMPTVDKKGQKITVFDIDIANEDHIYLFNREIKMYLLESKDLQINEEAFDKYKEDTMGARMNDTSGLNFVPQVVKTCMENSNAISSSSDRNIARISCFNKHLPELRSMNQCTGSAVYIESSSDRNIANITCFNRFNMNDKKQ